MKEKTLTFSEFLADSNNTYKVAITLKGRSHSGIIIKYKEGEDLYQYYIHFAGSNDIRLIPLPDLTHNDHICLGIEKIVSQKGKQEDILATLVTLAESISDCKEQNIPFSFNYTGATFNLDTGKFPEDSYGLTCATFVVSFFKSVNIYLVNYPNWPIRNEDTDMMIETLEVLGELEGLSKEELRQKIKEEFPCSRVRPNEVFASAMYPYFSAAEHNYCSEIAVKCLAIH
jgi:hypothetical protein